MRILVWLLVSLCAASAALAQDVIVWSSERRLTRSDFKGRVPPNAATASMSWLNIDVSWECAAGELSATVHATFDPGRSWWRAAQGNIWDTVGERRGGVSGAHLEARRSAVQRDSQLLEHEQLHFDLTELSARRLKAQVGDLKDVCDGADDGDRVRQTVAQVDRELQEEQGRYDRETAHGTNAVAQARWIERVRKLLK